MKYLTLFLSLLLMIFLSDCKKTDQTTKATKKHGKSPVPFLRLSGGDGYMILSAGIDNISDNIINPVGIAKDTMVSQVSEEVFAFFPNTGDGGPQNFDGAGNIFFNHHRTYQNTDSSYLLLAFTDTFNFDTTSQFFSNWRVYGGFIPGFTDTFSHNIFPSGFQFTIDTIMHKSTGYTISLSTGLGGITSADSIMYYIYDINNQDTFVVKSISGIGPIAPMVFSPSDLSVFTAGQTLSIEVVAYNYRLVSKGLQNIYFVNQRRYSNAALSLKP